MSDHSSIYHFESMPMGLGTSGQPKRDEFALIRDAGYAAVINLALPSSDHAVADEGSIVTGLGMIYMHIPVDFAAPTEADMQAFVGALRALEGQNVWVHCVVNARVSAFVYRYLTEEKGLPAIESETELLKAWRPQMDEVWQRFLRD